MKFMFYVVFLSNRPEHTESERERERKYNEIYFLNVFHGLVPHI